MPEIILASSSPRRRMLLEQVGIPFVVVIPSILEESMGQFPASPQRMVMRNAERKARSVIDAADGRAILAADTVVELDGEVLGKPVDAGDARRMLTRLSGREHLVHTGIALIDPVKDKVFQRHSVTRVRFRALTRKEIEDYIRSGEPMDKAGAYGIQGRGAWFIEWIEGCFFNVMGLPLAELWKMLEESGDNSKKIA